jgi:hypothetical protein
VAHCSPSAGLTPPWVVRPTRSGNAVSFERSLRWSSVAPEARASSIRRCAVANCCAAVRPLARDFFGLGSRAFGMGRPAAMRKRTGPEDRSPPPLQHLPCADDQASRPDRLGAALQRETSWPRRRPSTTQKREQSTFAWMPACAGMTAAAHYSAEARLSRGRGRQCAGRGRAPASASAAPSPRTFGGTRIRRSGAARDALL